MKNQTETLEKLICDRELLIEAGIAAMPSLSHTCTLGRLDTIPQCPKCRMISALSRIVPTCPECAGAGFVFVLNETDAAKACPVCNGACFSKR